MNNTTQDSFVGPVEKVTAFVIDAMWFEERFEFWLYIPILAMVFAAAMAMVFLNAITLPAEVYMLSFLLLFPAFTAALVRAPRFIMPVMAKKKKRMPEFQQDDGELEADAIPSVHIVAAVSMQLEIVSEEPEKAKRR